MPAFVALITTELAIPSGTISGALIQIWTGDLSLTKGVLYHWAIRAENLYSLGAGDEGRTRDIQLGRLTLYQLSYFRNFVSKIIGNAVQT